MKRKTIAQLEADLDIAKQALYDQRLQTDKAKADLQAGCIAQLEAVAAITRRINAKDQDIAALKAELFQAHQAIASQQGYIARTLEDDNMRELGPVQPDPRPSNEFLAPQSRRMGIPSFNSFDNSNRYGSRQEKAWHDR